MRPSAQLPVALLIAVLVAACGDDTLTPAKKDNRGNTGGSNPNGSWIPLSPLGVWNVTGQDNLGPYTGQVEVTQGEGSNYNLARAIE